MIWFPADPAIDETGLANQTGRICSQLPSPPNERLPLHFWEAEAYFPSVRLLNVWREDDVNAVTVPLIIDPAKGTGPANSVESISQDGEESAESFWNRVPTEAGWLRTPRAEAEATWAGPGTWVRMNLGPPLVSGAWRCLYLGN